MRFLIGRSRLACAASIAAAAGVAVISARAVSPRQARATDAPLITVPLHEGTSMAAALSPDGRTLAIDLLGSLWTMPANGGDARRVTDEYMDARQPVWSPDGRRIAFQGYRDGIWHIWAMNADGSGLAALTSGPFDDREPSWSADGRHIAFSSDRSGSYDIWDLDVGAGSVRQITRNAANDYAPAWSPTGRAIAFVSDRTDQRGVWSVDPATGVETLIAPAPGSVNAPSWSPDGSKVIYTVINGGESRLMLDGRAISSKEDVFPFRPQWMSANEVIYTADGVIKKRSIDSGPATAIPFNASVSFTRAPYTHARRDYDSRAARRVRGIMAPAISPDGKQVAFAALGDLWVMPIGGTPTRITRDRFVEMGPAWSPDGRSLAFSSDRSGTMDLWVRDMQTGAERKMAPDATKASWSPKGAQLVYVTHDGAIRVTGRAEPVHGPMHDPGKPTWAPEGLIAVSELQPYSSRFREGTNQLVLVSTTGAPDRKLNPVAHHSIGTRENDGPAWSPDGSKMAFVMDGLLQVMPVTPTGEVAGPPRQVSNEVADSPSWAADSRHLLYQTLDGVRLIDVNGGKDVDVPINLTWQPSIPQGRLVVHAGRLFDGRSATLRAATDIVIRDNRIEQVVPHRAELHDGRVIDAANDVVMPGLIEMHAHLRKEFGDALGRIWLAYGITSIRNPAANPYEAIEDRESMAAGVRVGPRIFTTGSPFDGSRIYYSGGVAVNSDRQFRLELDRAARLEYDLFKTYVRLPDQLQKDVIAFAHQHGTPVTSHEIYPAVASGADGVEHIRGTSRRGYSPKVTALNHSYRDVIDLLTASKMTITPTLGIQGWFPLALARDPSRIDDPRFRTLFPSWIVDTMDQLAKAGRPDERAAREALLKPYGDTVVNVVRGGGRVIAGTDSPIFPYALALHTELELFVQSGLTPFEALQTATTNAADALGEAANLGSIEAGKLADLVVVAGDPLADITNARKVRLTIRNGEVVSLDDLLKRAPYESPQSRPRFENPLRN
jgi:Tol biopolymer transport system component/imidazolonepropionase-like amidohydrolase